MTGSRKRAAQPKSNNLFLLIRDKFYWSKRISASVYASGFFLVPKTFHGAGEIPCESTGIHLLASNRQHVGRPKKQNLAHGKPTCHLPAVKQIHVGKQRCYVYNHDRHHSAQRKILSHWSSLTNSLRSYLGDHLAWGYETCKAGLKALTCICLGCRASEQYPGY